MYLSTINTGSSLYRFDPITNDTINLGVFSRINEILSVGDQVVILAQKSTFDDKQLFISDGIMPLKRFRVIEGVEEHSIDIRRLLKINSIIRPTLKTKVMNYMLGILSLIQPCY